MLKFRAAFRAGAAVALAVVISTSCGRDSGGISMPMEPQLTTLRVGAESFTRIEERAPNSSVLSLSKVIGLLGGTVSVANHAVDVPFGAVTLPTLFTLTHANNGYVEVDATATVTDLLGRIIDVGSLGFNKPVTITLTYARATNVTDPTRLKIVRLKPNGRHEVIPSTVNTANKTVSAKLDHFSRYCLVSD